LGWRAFECALKYPSGRARRLKAVSNSKRARRPGSKPHGNPRRIMMETWCLGTPWASSGASMDPKNWLNRAWRGFRIVMSRGKCSGDACHRSWVGEERRRRRCGFILETRPNGQAPLGQRRSSWNHWRPSRTAISFNHFKLFRTDAMANGVMVAPLHLTCNEGFQMACHRPDSGAGGIKARDIYENQLIIGGAGGGYPRARRM